MTCAGGTVAFLLRWAQSLSELERWDVKLAVSCVDYRRGCGNGGKNTPTCLIRPPLFRSLHTSTWQGHWQGDKLADVHFPGPPRTRLVKGLEVAAPVTPPSHAGRPGERRTSTPPHIHEPSAGGLARR